MPSIKADARIASNACRRSSFLLMLMPYVALGSSTERRRDWMRAGDPETSARKCLIKWWPGSESNQRHADFQSAALPTELPGQAGRTDPETGSTKRRVLNRRAPGPSRKRPRLRVPRPSGRGTKTCHQPSQISGSLHLPSTHPRNDPPRSDLTYEIDHSRSARTGVGRRRRPIPLATFSRLQALGAWNGGASFSARNARRRSPDGGPATGSSASRSPSRRSARRPLFARPPRLAARSASRCRRRISSCRACRTRARRSGTSRTPAGSSSSSCSKPLLPGYRAFHPDFEYLFNSYYQTVGRMHERPQRGLLTRPTVDEVLQYREHVDEHMQKLLARAARGRDVCSRSPTLGLNHEQQHQELMLTDIKHLFSRNPLLPAYRPGA